MHVMGVHICEQRHTNKVVGEFSWNLNQILTLFIYFVWRVQGAPLARAPPTGSNFFIFAKKRVRQRLAPPPTRNFGTATIFESRGLIGPPFWKTLEQSLHISEINSPHLLEHIKRNLYVVDCWFHPIKFLHSTNHSLSAWKKKDVKCILTKK